MGDAMADEYEYDDETTSAEQEYNPRDLRAQLKAAKAEAKGAEALRAENEALKQQMAVSEAGLSLTEVQRKALLAVHTGDMNPTSLQSTAQSLGFVAPPPPVPDDPSLTVHSQIAAAAAGAETSVVDRDAEIDRLIENATTEEELLAAYRTSGRPML